jgi:TRAP-type transport system periplasmic protein
MSRLTRRTLLRSTGAAAGIATFGILTTRGTAAEFVFRYANNNVAAHPMNVRLREAAEGIRQESGGRMEIQLFPNSQLGGDTDMLSQLRTGAIQMFNLSGLILATYVPVAAINGIGFAFKDYPQVWAAMDGALGAFVRGAIAKFYEVQKYVSLTNHMWDGFWTLANARAWAELPKDLQQIVARNINGAALREREDVRQLNQSMQGELARRGMVFNQTDTEKFRATLRGVKFYAEWKQKYGPEAWAALEKQVGSLS